MAGSFAISKASVDLLREHGRSARGIVDAAQVFGSDEVRAASQCRCCEGGFSGDERLGSQRGCAVLEGYGAGGRASAGREWGDVTLKVTVWPNVDGLSDEVMVVEVAACLTVWVRTAELLVS